MGEIRRFTRLLVPLPPIAAVQDYVKEKIEKTFEIVPEFLSTPDFDGYAISWPSWYGFTAGTTTIKAERFKSMFGSMRYEEMSGVSLEETGIIELIDEDDWEYLDLENEEVYSEVFSGRYEENGDSLTIFPHFIRFNQGPGIIFEYTWNEIPEYLEKYYEKKNDPDPEEPWTVDCESVEVNGVIPMVETLRKLAKRGFFNSQEVPSDVARDIYNRLGL